MCVCVCVTLYSLLCPALDWDTFGRPGRELNGGLLVLRPNASLVPEMLAAAQRMPASVTLEQSFFTRYFDWQQLPVYFNAPSSLYLRAPSEFPAVRVVHYTHAKPWQEDYSEYPSWYRQVHEAWWRAFADMQRGFTWTPE